jgi:hypothetical protein
VYPFPKPPKIGASRGRAGVGAFEANDKDLRPSGVAEDAEFRSPQEVTEVAVVREVIGCESHRRLPADAVGDVSSA